MKRLLPLLLLSGLLAIGALWRLHADDHVTAQMLALFPQFDADHNGVLTPEEQSNAVDAVKQKFGDQWATQIRKMFARAASPDKTVTTDHWRQEVADYGQPPTQQTVMIPMRDGKKLATDIYLPHGTGPFPVVLTRTPYHRLLKGGAEGYTRSGMVFISQDMRGRFESEGENLPFIGCGWGEHQDGVDTLAWIRQQPWCNGDIGTIGTSAGGITQNLLAGAHPDGLKAQYMTVAAASLYSDAIYIGGAFRKADNENWLTQNKFDPRASTLIHTHPSYDDYWRQFDTRTKFAEINVPAVHIGGWFDIFTQGTIDEFVGRQHSGAPGAKGAQKLIMGPWTHAIGKMPAGEFTFPNATKPPQQYDSGRWFAHYLLGENNGIEKEPAVTYYVMGDTSVPNAPGNEWRYADDWPIPATETAYYLNSGAILDRKLPPSKEDVPLEFTFDPAKPCPTVGGNNLTIARGPMNQNSIEDRLDVLVFTTASLPAPVEVTGRIKAKIFVSSSAVDTDLSVRLSDVYPDGKSYLIAEGMQRLRYRHSSEKPELLTPGKIEEVTVDCWSTSFVFNKGHGICVTITSSNYPHFDLNPGTGEVWSDSGPKVKQTNRIYHDATHPSEILLPVVTAQ